MSTTEASSSQQNEKLSHPTPISARCQAAEKKFLTLPQNIYLFILRASKTYFADFRAGMPI
jgi:hypothetical protein